MGLYKVGHHHAPFKRPWEYTCPLCFLCIEKSRKPVVHATANFCGLHLSCNTGNSTTFAASKVSTARLCHESAQNFSFSLLAIHKTKIQSGGIPYLQQCQSHRILVSCIYCSWQYYNWYRYPNLNMSRVDLDMRPLAFEYFGLIDGTSDIHLDHGVSMIQLLRSTLWNWILNNEVGFRTRTRYWCATLKTWGHTWMYGMACPFLPRRGKPSSPQPIRYSIWVAFLVTLKCSCSCSKVKSTLPESTAHEHVTLGFWEQ
jgi:hypothetical protein